MVSRFTTNSPNGGRGASGATRRGSFASVDSAVYEEIQTLKDIHTGAMLRRRGSVIRKEGKAHDRLKLRLAVLAKKKRKAMEKLGLLQKGSFAFIDGLGPRGLSVKGLFAQKKGATSQATSQGSSLATLPSGSSNTSPQRPQHVHGGSSPALPSRRTLRLSPAPPPASVAEPLRVPLPPSRPPERPPARPRGRPTKENAKRSAPPLPGGGREGGAGVEDVEEEEPVTPRRPEREGGRKKPVDAWGSPRSQRVGKTQEEEEEEEEEEQEEQEQEQEQEEEEEQQQSLTGSLNSRNFAVSVSKNGLSVVTSPQKAQRAEQRQPGSERNGGSRIFRGNSMLESAVSLSTISHSGGETDEDESEIIYETYGTDSQSSSDLAELTPLPPASAVPEMLVSPMMRLSGTVTWSALLQVEGYLSGTLVGSETATVVVAKGGVREGDVTGVKTVVVERGGRIVGGVEAERVVIRSGGAIVGNVFADSLLLESGGILVGAVEIRTNLTELEEDFGDDEDDEESDGGEEEEGEEEEEWESWMTREQAARTLERTEERTEERTSERTSESTAEKTEENKHP